MRKKRKTVREGRGAALLLLTLFLLFWGCGVLADSGSHVFDLGGVFYPSQIRELEETARELEEAWNMNVLVLSVDEAYGMSSREVAEEFYEEYGYDSNGLRGGIVLLLDLDNREINLVTSGDMIYYITDEREERIYDAAQPALYREAYGEAILAMLEQTGQYIEAGIPGNQYVYDSETGKISRQRTLSGWEAGLAVAGALAMAGVACGAVSRRYRMVQPYEYPVGQNAGIQLTGREDRLVNQFVTRRRIPTNPPGGPGRPGSGGRTTIHRSSRGGSFGGGHGRKF